jgi:hypothetical protein
METILLDNIRERIAICVTLLVMMYCLPASAAPRHCAKDGDAITVVGHVSAYMNGGTTLQLSTPLCVQDSSLGNRVNSLTTVGWKLPSGVEMTVRGKLHRSKMEMGFEIRMEAAEDVHAKEKALYEKVHGADALSTCLQWQQDNKGPYVDGLSLIFYPECGVKTRDSLQGPLSEKLMPAPGEGFATAQKIVDAAVAQRLSPTEAFDECGQWQMLALDALAQNNYPAYPNATQQYVFPRCGVRLSNNVTRKYVYLWLPASLTPMSSTAENEKHRCVRQERTDGVDAYTFVPCVILDLQHALHGVTLTSIKTSPPGALLMLNGNVIAQSPALVVFQQPGSFKGFLEGDVSFKTSDVVQIQLTRNPQ